MNKKNVYITKLSIKQEKKQFPCIYEKKKRDLLKYAIEKEYGFINYPIKFIYGVSGKPYLKQGFPQFNFSNSGEYLACVLDDDEIGIDIQKVRDISDKVFKNFFPICPIGKMEKVIEWTKYESYGKMLGIGIPYKEDYASSNFLFSFEIKNYVITVCMERCKKKNSLSIKFI